MNAVRLVIPGEPVAKGRARVRVINGRPSLYTPKTTINAEKIVKAEAYRIFRGQPLTGPLMIRVDAFFAIRPSWTKKKQAALLGQPHMIKPDWDNLGKLFCDALNGIVYVDDAQIAGGLCMKWWSDRSRTEITVTPIEFGALGVSGMDLTDVPMVGAV